MARTRQADRGTSFANVGVETERRRNHRPLRCVAAGGNGGFNHSLAALQGDGRYVLDFDGQLCTRRLQRQFDGSVLIQGEDHGFKDMLVPRHHVEQIAVAGPCIWADTWLV